MGRFLSFGRSPKPADTPGTPENLQLDDLLLFSEDSLPVSLLKHNPDNQGRAVKMFQSVLQYMGVHGEMLGAMAALELAQKLLHQGLKRVELRDELYMQLVKQTRGNPNPAARTKAWQLFYLTAATMPPSKDFMGLVSGALGLLLRAGCGVMPGEGWGSRLLSSVAAAPQVWQQLVAVRCRRLFPPASSARAALSAGPPRTTCGVAAAPHATAHTPLRACPAHHLLAAPCPRAEYVHTCAHDAEELPEVRDLATKTWQAMKRTAKAGQRRTLPDMQEIDALFKGAKQNAVVYFLDETFEELSYDASTTVMEAVEQLAGQIKLENYQTFSLFAVQKVRPDAWWRCPGMLQVAARAFGTGQRSVLAQGAAGRLLRLGWARRLRS